MVLDDEYFNHPCQNSLRPYIDSEAPFVFLKSWDSLTDSLNALLNNEEELQARQDKLKYWYINYWNDLTKSFECQIQENFLARKKRQQEKTKKMEEDGDEFEEPDCSSSSNLER